MKTAIVALAMSGAALAQLPNYPLVYSPEAGGPVANPAYSRPAAAAASEAPGAYAPVHFQRYSVGLAIGYGFMAVPHSKYATDVVTGEIEGAYHFTPKHAATLSIGLASGGETNDYWVREHHHYEPFTDSFDRTSFTLMAGYRYTQPLARRVSLQLGAKCGLDVQTLDVDYGYGWSGYPYGYYDDGQRDTKAGMAYAGYANVVFHLARNADLLMGYQFRGSTVKPEPRTGYPDEPRYHTGSMRWHEVRIGIATRF